MTLPVGVGRSQHRQAVVDRSVGIDAEIDPAAVLEDPPVGREADPPLAPRQARRRAGGQGRQRDLLDRVGQLAGVALDPRRSGRAGAALPKMKSSSLLKAGPQWVCVEQTTNRSRFSADLVLQPRRHLFGHLRPDGAIVDGHQHGGPAFGRRRRRSPEPGP